MSKTLVLAAAFVCPLILSACGGGRHGARQAKVAAARINGSAAAKPAPVAAPADVRQIADQIYLKKYELRGQGYYGFDRQTLPGWVNDWKGYDAGTRERIRGLAREMKTLAAQLKAASLGQKSAEGVSEADEVSQRADHVLRRMSRMDREESALKQFRPLFRR